ncbi:MAG: nitroreductase family protein [Butyricicoccus sp.]|nr:nitroreductase family protein [Butyricicoccus sp.]
MSKLSSSSRPLSGLRAAWASSFGISRFHFTVLYNADKSLELAHAVGAATNRGADYNFYQAPVQIIISYERDEQHAFLDGSAAMENILLTAESLGLGSCWINQIRDCCDAPEVRKLLTSYGVPSSHIVIASAAIGYIAKGTPAKPRKEGTVTFVE